MTQLLVQDSPRPATPTGTDDELPYLADGVELIGKYEDSGFRNAPYLVKRGDGQVIQVSKLLFLVASALDASGDAEEAATQVSNAYGRDVSADNVRYLVEKKLRPIGLLWSPDGADQAPVARANPLLALHLRLPLVPERAHRLVTTGLMPLFWPPVIVLILGLLVAFDVWLVVGMGAPVIAVAQTLIYAPQLLLPLTALTVLMGLFHEIGHATAARYGGAKPGAMGCGIYLVWPCFYTDVTDSYRLGRRGRLRTDLGGVYFNALFIVTVGALYLTTGQALFLVFIMLAHLETARQFLPFIRFDGYYILADLAGVPNPFRYMGPALAKAAMFWKRGDRGALSRRTLALKALTPRTQIVMIVWACITGPIIAFHIVMLVIFLPEIAGAAWGSAGIQLDILATALSHARLGTAGNAALGLVFLLLPTFGIGYIALRRARRIGRLVQRGWVKQPLLTGALATAAGLFVAFQVGTVWPHKFAEAASAPGRAQAEAQAALTTAEARARLLQGAEALSDVVARMTPGLLIPSPNPIWPAPPPAPPAAPDTPADDSAATASNTTPDGGSRTGAGGDGITGDGSASSSAFGSGGSGASGSGAATGPAPAPPAPGVAPAPGGSPGVAPPPPAPAPRPAPTPTTTTTAVLPAVEDLLGLLVEG